MAQGAKKGWQFSETSIFAPQTFHENLKLHFVMKKQFTLLSGFVLAALMQFAAFSVANAQTEGAGIVVEIKTSAGTASYKNENCGYGTASWGGAVNAEFCAPVSWVRDINPPAPDTLGCDSVPAGSLTGKVALVRRGTCEFGTKALNAEKAGAIAVFIVNNNVAANGDDCAQIPIGPGAVGAQVTVPVFFLSRSMAAALIADLDAGKPVEACFLLPSMKDPTSEFSYATPISQRAPLGLITVQYTNRSGADQTDVRFKVDVIDPVGAVTSFTTTVDLIPAGTTDTLINFDEYDIPNIEGKYKLVYSNNKYTTSRDTLTREFVMTRYTYATDNLKPSGNIGPSDQQFLDASFKYQTAGMVATGAAGLKVEYASFGMGNASTIAVGDPAADIVNVLLYDNDANDDGQADLDAGFSDLFPIAFADYTFSKEKADSLVYPKLESLAGEPEVALKPDHLYMISILYDGNSAGTGKSLTFTRSAQVAYPQFVGIGLHTPLLLDALYSGWGGSTVVTRLHEKGFDPVSKNDPFLTSSTQQARLSETKFNVTPNPANDIVRLNLDLAGVNKTVAATLIDFQGRAVDSQVSRNFQNGQLTFNATKLPSGAYTIWIRTSDEGSTMAKLMICH